MTAALRRSLATSATTILVLLAATVVAIVTMLALLVGATASGAAVGDVITVEAEDFTADANFDTQPGNQGNSTYRAGQDVDVWFAYNDAGNHVIGTTRAGEWTEYAVTVADAGDYRFNLRLASGRANPGEIAVTVDGAPVGTIDFANSGGWWNWQNPAAGTVGLAAGTHTVRITWLGEANINFDQFTLTQVADGGCPSLTVEAETGTIVGAMAVESGAGASGGAYLVTSTGGNASTPNVSYADLCVTVATAGRYRLDGRVQNPNDRDDSFWVSIDNGGAALWDTRISNGWTTDAVRARSIANPAVWQLSAGQHIIRVSAREDRSRLDRLTLVATDLPATDLGNAITPPDVRTPASDNVVPGRLEAELFDYGTPADPAYSDTDPANVGGAFRTNEAVDIYNTFGENGQVIGRTRGGEFVEFTVFPEQVGTYLVRARLATGASQPGSIVVTSGDQQAGPASISPSEWWDFTEVELGTITFDDPASQILRLSWTGNGNLNTDWIELVYVEPGGFNPYPTPGPYVPDPQQSPYGGQAAAVPGRIDAENFDLGGSGIAWSDASAANVGDANFRTGEGVDVGQAIDPFGRFVGWLDDGDWAEYTIVADDILADRQLALFSRVASAWEDPGSLLVSINGTPMATIDIPATGGWQNWETVPYGGFSIPPGTHTMRLTAIDGGRFNLNFVRFDLELPQEPYREHIAPGLIQLEDYDFGDRRIGYNDQDAENTGGEYRWDAADKFQSNDADGSYYLGDTGNGEWAEYTFTAVATGSYDLHLRAASADGSAQPVELLIDRQPVASVPVTSTAWSTRVAGPVFLTAGEHRLRVRTPSGSVNLNWLQITNAGQTFTPPTALTGTVQVSPDQDLGSLVLRSAPGTRFELLAGTHDYVHVFPKDGQKFVGLGALGAAKLVGDQVRNPIFAGSANNVEIRNLDLSNAGTGFFVGAISARDNNNFARSGSNWIVEGNRIHDNSSVGVNMGPGMRVLDNEIFENGQIGISGVGRDITRLADVLVEGNDIHHNGPEQFGIQPFNFHEGGMKTTFSDRLIVRNNNVHDNYGVGLYCDLHCDDVLYENNQLINNVGPGHAGGLFYEWSTNGTIRNNTVVNGNANPEREVVIGIRVGESQDVVVTGNILTMGSSDALDIRSCCATEGDPSFIRLPSARVVFSNNTVTSTSSGTRIRDIGNQGTFSGNSYTNAGGQVQFFRGESQRSWAQWQALGNDTGSAAP